MNNRQKINVKEKKGQKRREKRERENETEKETEDYIEKLSIIVTYY